MARLLVALLPACIALAGSVGWVRNVIIVSHSDFHSLSGELIVRVIGIPMAPVGAVMGFVGN